MLSRDQKAEIVAGLENCFQRQRISIFTNLHGVAVGKLARFRRELKALGAELKVAKKTLLHRALQAANLAVDPKVLEGEIGVVFGYEDQVAPARAAAKFSKENETFKVLKGVLAGKILEAKEVLALAKLPAREQLLAQVAAAFNAPIQGLVNVLQGTIGNLVVVLNQIKEKK